MLKTLRKSLIQQKPIEMIYISDKNEITHRFVTIQQITDAYVIAFCYLRKRKRTFKIENILSCEMRSNTLKLHA